MIIRYPGFDHMCFVGDWFIYRNEALGDPIKCYAEIICDLEYITEWGWVDFPAFKIPERLFFTVSFSV